MTKHVIVPSDIRRPLRETDREQVTIAGASMGGKGGSGSGGGTEAPDNLRSRQIAKVVDLLSEGPIRGIVGGLKGIYLDGVPMVNKNGTTNFTGASVQWVHGLPAQPIMNGFSAQQAENVVGVPLKYNSPITRNIGGHDFDRCRITVSVPSLQVINKDTGDIKGTSVKYRIQCDNNGGGFKLIGDFTISGKSSSLYQRSVMFLLPKGGPWQIRVTRLTADSTKAELQNDLNWDSYTEIVDDRVNYTMSACVGTLINAEQFRTIPKRTYLTDGLMVLVPNNYNPDTATYTGVWSGVFKRAWTCNPAWVLYDLLVNNRYGLGQFVGATYVDKWSLYKIAQWCDQRVPNGKPGGYRLRWTINVQIMSQQDAFDLLAQICSVFRGFTFWTGGQMVGVADQPDDPVMQFTNANVVGGQFQYSGADIRARHNQAQVTWNDPEMLGETRISVVEDQVAISRLGIQKIDIPAIGCTNEAQALATGKWTLFTEQYEAETVIFTTGLEGARARPGMIARISDFNIAGRRYGGRVGAGSTASHVIFDAFPVGAPNAAFQLSCQVGPNAAIETKPGTIDDIDNPTGIIVSAPFSGVPILDSVFVLNDPGDLEPTLWRILGVRQTQSDQYELTAMRHLPSKWEYVDYNHALTIPDVSDITPKPPPVSGLTYIEYLVQTSSISVGVAVTLSWKSSQPLFEIFYRPQDGNWQNVRTDAQAIDLVVNEGPWEFQVTAIGSLGIKSTTANLKATIVGRSAPPQPPKQLRINVVDGVAMFDWLPATELDVIIGGRFELRFSPRTSGATWNTAQTVIPSIPGRATSVETGYQPGTWMLRTFDILGLASATWATVIAELPDSRYTGFVRICEQPDWLGTKTNTQELLPQEWLVIGETGGLIDDQTGLIDSWPPPAIDVLPLPPDAPLPANTGTYLWNKRIDAGAPFSVRLSADILAFPFSMGDETIDERLTDCDTWSNWDDTSADAEGQVTIEIRDTMDDPAGAPVMFMNDTMTGTNGTVITAHVGELGATWVDHGITVNGPAATIQTNRYAAGTGVSIYRSSGIPSSADYYVEATYDFIAANANDNFGILGRMQFGADTYYWARFSQSVGGFQLWKLVANVGTQLGATFADTFASGSRVLRLDMVGSTIRMLVNNVVAVAVTDTTIPAAGPAGLRNNVTAGTMGRQMTSIQAFAAGHPAIWSNWRSFISGEHYARAFEFRSTLSAPPGDNIGVETMCMNADLRNKIDAGNDVPYSAVITRVYFNIKFYNVPAVVITLQLAMAEDRIEIVSKTREYFELRITMTSSGTNPVGARTFDWHAQGY